MNINRNRMIISTIIIFVCVLNLQVLATDAATSPPFDKNKTVNGSSAIFTIGSDKTTGDMKIYGKGATWLTVSACTYLGAKVVPYSDLKIKIGFSGDLDYTMNALGIATVQIHVVLCDADMNELDSHLVYTLQWTFSQGSVERTDYFTSVYNMDGGYTLISGRTYYACVKFLASFWGTCKLTGPGLWIGSALLDVSKISWVFY